MSIATLAALFLETASPGVAPIDSQWEVVDRAQDGDCALVVTGNGKIFLISATGLGANAPARMVLTNGDMKPIDWRVRANSSGRFARYHMPFRWHRNGGTVSVTVAGGNCTVSSSFEWRRAGSSSY